MDFVIRANRITQLHKMLTFKGETHTVTFDYSPWADDFGAVTSVTVTVESGQGSIGNESIASSVKTLTVTTAETGASMLKLVSGGAGNNVRVDYLYVFTKDPTAIREDYGMQV